MSDPTLDPGFIQLPPGPLPEPKRLLVRRRTVLAIFLLGIAPGFTGGFMAGALVGALRTPPPIEMTDPAFHAELEKTISELQRSTDFWRGQAESCDGGWDQRPLPETPRKANRSK